MRITRQDLPESIAEAYEAQLKDFDAPPSTSVTRLFMVPAAAAQDGAVSNSATELQKAKKVFEASQDISRTETAATGFVILIDALVLLGLFFVAAAAGGYAALILFLAIAGFNLVFIGWCRREEQRRRYLPKVLRAILPLVAKDPVEVLYLAALLRLMEQDNLLGDSVSRGLLTQMNALLESSQEIGQQQEGIHAAISNQSLAEIEAMRDDLAARIEQSKDSQARETLRQTLLLCESRLARAAALAPLKERLEAQQEMIRQTLASVGESLAGLRIAPQAMREPQMEIVRDTLEQIQRQTRSIEQAVQEVMALRAF